MSERYDHGIDLDYFIAHQDELVAKYNGKQLVMHGAKVVGAFDTLREAWDEGDKLFGDGNYSVQKCIPGEEAYTIDIPFWQWGGALA